MKICMEGFELQVCGLKGGWSLKARWRAAVDDAENYFVLLAWAA
jgi:hypothetical protein